MTGGPRTAWRQREERVGILRAGFYRSFLASCFSRGLDSGLYSGGVNMRGGERVGGESGGGRGKERGGPSEVTKEEDRRKGGYC